LSLSSLLRFWPFGFPARFDGSELMDVEQITAEELDLAYRQLDAVHGWLGNRRAVLRLLRDCPGGKPGRVLDIGCGQGALLREIRDRLGAEVAGFDLRPAPPGLGLPIACGNAATDSLPMADVAVCVAMAHHLTVEELVATIRNVARSCNRLILLDLVRHPAPYWLFRVFVAPVLGRINALDGLTSIRRSFTASEMRRIVDEALAGAAERRVSRLRHTVALFWIRQVVDICWE
jgi:2-polyprenyl-3-methyl-5-hydroxy-6-metoxy-1,4-benzoquinol methylase